MIISQSRGSLCTLKQFEAVLALTLEQGAALDMVLLLDHSAVAEQN